MERKEGKRSEGKGEEEGKKKTIGGFKNPN